MIVSIAEPVQLLAKNTTTLADRVKPKVRITRKRGKLVVTATSAPKSRTPPQARRGTKTATILRLLQRPQGASLAELTKATKWQAHSVRGFLSGTLKGKMRLKVSSIKREDGERAYRLPAK